MEDSFSLIFEDIDSSEVAFRYMSHATFKRQDVTFKVWGSELRKLLDRHPDFRDVRDVELFYAVEKLRHHAQLEAEWIFETVERMFREAE